MSGIYGEITGTVKINDELVQRQLIGISYEPQTFEGEEAPRRIVVGETTSAEDGTYTLQTPGFIDEVIVLALENYGEIWRPNRAYEVGQRIRPTRGNETGYGYDITIAGNSGETEPLWWVPAGGSDTGAIGAATAQALPLWWSVAHAPILPIEMGEAPFVDEHFASVSTVLNFIDMPDGTTITDPGIRELAWSFVNAPQIVGGKLEIRPSGSTARRLQWISNTMRDLYWSGVPIKWTMEFDVTRLTTANSIVMFWNESFNPRGFELQFRNDGTMRFTGYRNNGTLFRFITPALNGERIEVAISRNEGEIFFHVNGEYIESALTTLEVNSGSASSDNNPFSLGGSHSDPTINAGNFDLHKFRMTEGVARYGAADYEPAGPRFPLGAEP